jgi:hypothetical protein
LTAFISPYQSDRDLARTLHEQHNPPIPFIEVYVDAPLSVVEERDPKGLYAKARKGEIKGQSDASLPVFALIKQSLPVSPPRMKPPPSLRSTSEPTRWTLPALSLRLSSISRRRASSRLDRRLKVEHATLFALNTNITESYEERLSKI